MLRCLLPESKAGRVQRKQQWIILWAILVCFLVSCVKWPQCLVTSPVTKQHSVTSLLTESVTLLLASEIGMGTNGIPTLTKPCVALGINASVLYSFAREKRHINNETFPSHHLTYSPITLLLTHFPALWYIQAAPHWIFHLGPILSTISKL